MNELLTSICSFLAANSFGVVGTNLFAQTLPTTPCICTAVYLGGGPDGADTPIRERSIEIVHRNTHVESGSYVATLIHSLLNDRWNFLPNFPGRIVTSGEPGIYGYDQNNYPVFSVELNFTSTK